MYRLIKDGYSYEGYSELEEILEDFLSLDVSIVDIYLLSDWIKEGIYNTETLIKLRQEMKENERDEVYWLSDEEYFIIPEEWTSQSVLECLKTFDNDSTYEIRV